MSTKQNSETHAGRPPRYADQIEAESKLLPTYGRFMKMVRDRMRSSMLRSELLIRDDLQGMTAKNYATLSFMKAHGFHVREALDDARMQLHDEYSGNRISGEEFRLLQQSIDNALGAARGR